VKKALQNINKHHLLIMSSVLTLLVVFIILGYLIASSLKNNIVEATGTADSSFRIFYIENDIFHYNPIPSNQHFLMSFTDYIEVESRFTAQFSDDVEVAFRYDATMRLVIRYRATADGYLNPIVYELRRPLSQMHGLVTGDTINFLGHANEPGGTYTIHPREFIEIYINFVIAQQQQMEDENVIVQNLRGFTAEIFIDFMYHIYVPNWDIQETATHGYHFSISSEVYSLMATGDPHFSLSVNQATPSLQITLPIAVIIIMTLALGLYSLLVGTRRLRADPREYKQMQHTILKKYSNEIIVTNTPLQFPRDTLVQVSGFEELVKLAVNLNKHIVCYICNDEAEFVVVVDGYTYYFKCGSNSAEVDEAVKKIVDKVVQ